MTLAGILAAAHRERAEEIDVTALSIPDDREIAEVLGRPKFARAIPRRRREQLLAALRRSAIWFVPVARVKECRDAKDDKHLALALAAGAETIVSSDDDLLVLHPWRGIAILSPTDFLARAAEVIE